MFLDEGTDDFFVDLDGTKETNCFARQSLDTGAKRQVVTLNALRKYLARKVLILRNLSGITAPVVAGYHTDGEGLQ